MERRIIGFHEDDEGHWVAELECGHGQHVRHDPPWQERAWVTTDASRGEYIGAVLDCVLCDTEAPAAPDSAHEDAEEGPRG